VGREERSRKRGLKERREGRGEKGREEM